ncbi:hypothetical protein PpBr36_02744 [Pyricularia pennisetigena]|uniref:hypothetical protein n=1 Tax=Pyricularia pennisetigena TaxID=1578925 RepID=UPI0011536769|nr:hypothetical protein PpBr36_02744 [Pyricularia pennisetigena]TLS31575.1 hypothetical protein PpBr36_02744 [Pyricularia pennisetigena]
MTVLRHRVMPSQAWSLHNRQQSQAFLFSFASAAEDYSVLSKALAHDISRPG